MAHTGILCTFLFMCLFDCAISGLVFAGVKPGVQAGARVRATIVDRSSDSFRTRRITGILTEVTDSAFVFSTSANEPLMSVWRHDIFQLEESIGPSNRAKGALVGLGVGAGIGAVVGLASGDDPPGISSFSAEAKAGVAAVILGVAGALIWGVAGDGERWQAVEISGSTLGFENSVGQIGGLVVRVRL